MSVFKLIGESRYLFEIPQVETCRVLVDKIDYEGVLHFLHGTQVRWLLICVKVIVLRHC